MNTDKTGKEGSFTRASEFAQRLRFKIRIRRTNRDQAICWMGDGFNSDGINRLALAGRFAALFAFAGLAGPDVKTAMGKEVDLPRTPNSFAFAEAAVEHIVLAEITFGPGTLRINGVVAPFDEERADIIGAIAGDGAGCERKLEFHPM